MKKILNIIPGYFYQSQSAGIHRTGYEKAKAGGKLASYNL